MAKMRYRKREQQIVLGVQIDLDTAGFTYNKWGGEQSCRAGDWLVNNGGDCYTISKETFAKTYKSISPGQFIKTTPVWASQSTEPGKIKTNEGYTEYVVGDYLVSNNPDGTDTYAVSKKKFEEMYELVDANS